MTSDQVTTEVMIYDVREDIRPSTFATFYVPPTWGDDAKACRTFKLLHLGPVILRSGQVRIRSNRHSPAQLKQSILRLFTGEDVPLEPEDSETLRKLRRHLQCRKEQEHYWTHHFLAAAAIMSREGSVDIVLHKNNLAYSMASQQHVFHVGRPNHVWPDDPRTFRMDSTDDVTFLVNNLNRFRVSYESWMRVCLLPWTSPLESRDEWWVKLI